MKKQLYKYLYNSNKVVMLSDLDYQNHPFRDVLVLSNEKTEKQFGEAFCLCVSPYGNKINIAKIINVDGKNILTKDPNKFESSFRIYTPKQFKDIEKDITVDKIRNYFINELENSFKKNDSITTIVVNEKTSFEEVISGVNFKRRSIISMKQEIKESEIIVVHGKERLNEIMTGKYYVELKDKGYNVIWSEEKSFYEVFEDIFNIEPKEYVGQDKLFYIKKCNTRENYGKREVSMFGCGYENNHNL